MAVAFAKPTCMSQKNNDQTLTELVMPNALNSYPISDQNGLETINPLGVNHKMFHTTVLSDELFL